VRDRVEQPDALAREERTSWRDPWALAFALAALAAAALRFVRLGEWSLWIDEAFTLNDSLHPVAVANQLGYQVWGAYLQWLGERPDEYQLRLPSALFGVLGVPLACWAFSPAIGARGAAAAALLLALSPWHVYWSQTARFYTLAQDLSLIAGGLALRGLLGGRLVLALIGLGCAGIGALAHPSALALVPALALAPWLLHWAGFDLGPGARRVRVGLTLLGLALVLVAAPWLHGVWQRWELVKGRGNPLHFLLTAGFYFSPLACAAALFGAAIAARRRASACLQLACVTALVLASALLASFFVRVSAQYAFVVLPWVCALAAAPLELEWSARAAPSGAERRGRTGRALALAYLGALALPALVNTGLLLSVRHGERPQWREAYRYVHERRREGDLVLGMEAPVAEYYLAPHATELRNPRQLVWLDDWRAEVPSQWERSGRRTWIVLNLEQLEDWSHAPEREALLESLRTECRLVADWPLYVESRDLSVRVYLREGS